MIAAASLSSAKIVPPFAELDVRGEDDAATFVAAGDDLVEETGPVDVEGHVAELVEDDQVGAGEVPEQAVEGAVAFGLAELEHELRGLPEPHAPALLDGEHAQGGGQVGLSASRLAVEHEVLRLGREIEAGQLLLGVSCFASMFVRQVRQCFSVVWADGFPRCRHRFPVM